MVVINSNFFGWNKHVFVRMLIADFGRLVFHACPRILFLLYDDWLIEGKSNRRKQEFAKVNKDSACLGVCGLTGGAHHESGQQHSFFGHCWPSEKTFSQTPTRYFLASKNFIFTKISCLRYFHLFDLIPPYTKYFQFYEYIQFLNIYGRETYFERGYKKWWNCIVSHTSLIFHSSSFLGNNCIARLIFTLCTLTSQIVRIALMFTTGAQQTNDAEDAATFISVLCVSAL